jgi:hypothetical protein
VVGWRKDRRIVPFLIALAVAGLALKLLVSGNCCLVPSAYLKPGEAGTAEVSAYGVVLYGETGADHEAMYNRAVWWYQAALTGEWVLAVAMGAAIYSLLRWWWGAGGGQGLHAAG